METFHGYVTSPADALLLFEACRLGRIKRVQRRLAESERLAYVKSGAVFVWDEEESGIKRYVSLLYVCEPSWNLFSHSIGNFFNLFKFAMGLRSDYIILINLPLIYIHCIPHIYDDRWTDGKHWSPSRINGSFLIYREVEPRRRLDSNGAPIVSTNPAAPPTIEYVIKEHGLTKKAISITTSDGRKQHLVSYYTRDDLNNDLLVSPAMVQGLGDIIVEKDIYPEFMPDGAASSTSSLRTGDTASIRSTGSGGSGAGAPGYTKGTKQRRTRGNASISSSYSGAGFDDVGSVSGLSLAESQRYSTTSFEHPDVRFSHDSGVSIYSKYSDDSRSVRSFNSGHNMDGGNDRMDEDLGGIGGGEPMGRRYGMNDQGFAGSPALNQQRRVHRSPSVQSTPMDFPSGSGSLRRPLGGRTPSVHSLPIDSPGGSGGSGSGMGVGGGSTGRGERAEYILPLPPNIHHNIPHRNDHSSHSPSPHAQSHHLPQLPDPTSSRQQQSPQQLPPPMFLAHSNWTPDTDYGRRLLEGLGPSGASSTGSNSPSGNWQGGNGGQQQQGGGTPQGGDSMEVDEDHRY
ncbi:hypothetical protein HDV00_010514 [Rhizophlyctis rosea]|nr:hypothetical protein HDV00_010514 [Rhizophlyctis rosea]